RLGRHHDADRPCRADHEVAFNALITADTIEALAPSPSRRRASSRWPGAQKNGLQVLRAGSCDLVRPA
ncbi:MAG: hypothetical protein Q8M83_04255, partial [bacterium]|nr:hypothetical protein [bacterium]